MAKLNTLSASKTSRVLIFGPPKSGKSELAGKLSEYFNLIWVDIENGHDVLFKLPKSWQEKVEVVALPDTRHYPIGIETCLKIVKGAVDICEQHGKVRCMICAKAEAPTVHVDVHSMGAQDIIVYDSITQLTNSAIAHITKNQKEDYKLQYDDWNHLGVLMDTFFSYLQQADYNVVVISHEVEAETEGKKSKLVPVAGTRNFSRNVAKYFDHVVYCEVKNKKHVFASSTTYANNILTGSRTDIVMEELDEPSLLTIFKPELYASTSATATGKTKVATTKNVIATKTNTGKRSAADILAALRKK